MSTLFIHKFRITGMNNSANVTVVRARLGEIPELGAINVDLRKMQAEFTANKVIEVSALRKALGNAEFGLSEFTVTPVTAPRGVRDDEEEKTKQT